MKMQILLPKGFVDPTGPGMKDVPIFFLGGPVRGGGDWQSKMALMLADLVGGDCLIAIPARWRWEHPLAHRIVPTDRKSDFPRQLNWERYYLNHAGYHPRPGCIVFWLAVQREPRPIEDGPYAQDTYGELGEWRGRMMCNPSIRFVAGAEATFPGLSQIQRNFDMALGYDFPIRKTMEETAAAAMKAALA
jgi:hypothetical protein